MDGTPDRDRKYRNTGRTGVPGALAGKAVGIAVLVALSASLLGASGNRDTGLVLASSHLVTGQDNGGSDSDGSDGSDGSGGGCTKVISDVDQIDAVIDDALVGKGGNQKICVRVNEQRIGELVYGGKGGSFHLEGGLTIPEISIDIDNLGHGDH
jgi:hypothetical protein